MRTIDRRSLIKSGAVLAGGLAMGGPLQALAARVAAGSPLDSPGYGELIPMGDLALPAGFEYAVIARQGHPMSDGHPSPSTFDGMAAFPGADGTTILLRNHENKSRNARLFANEIPVVVPNELRYNKTETLSDPVTGQQVSAFHGGVTRMVVSEHEVIDSRSVLGGTIFNCAGGRTPWGSWITCEEQYHTYAAPDGTFTKHGYIFEVDAYATGPVEARPIRRAGRFDHEAVAWHNGYLYETEDNNQLNAFYRYDPAMTIACAGHLADSAGTLQGLRFVDYPGANTAVGWPLGEARRVDWVTVDNPEPATNSGAVTTPLVDRGIRFQAWAKGAAQFRRTEGCWEADGKIYFDCTTGGRPVDGTTNGSGQIWQLDPAATTLTLVFEVPPALPGQSLDLERPDNLAMGPVGNLYLCEDRGLRDFPFVRGLTPDGRIFDFARAQATKSEFCGACFDPKGLTLYVNQQGDPLEPSTSVTYAIWGPWKRRGDPNQKTSI